MNTTAQPTKPAIVPSKALELEIVDKIPTTKVVSAPRKALSKIVYPVPQKP